MHAYQQRISACPGTYALLLQLPAVAQIRVGGLGPITFAPGVYFYAGSAFGPGGLAGRLKHHLAAAPRPHWHIDYLRSTASVAKIWTSSDPRRLECVWAAAAQCLRSAKEIPGFGASDCSCASHLMSLPRLPQRHAFRRHMHLTPACAAIRLLSPATN